jgi:hypothetical protein
VPIQLLLLGELGEWGERRNRLNGVQRLALQFKFSCDNSVKIAPFSNFDVTFLKWQFSDGNMSKRLAFLPCSVLIGFYIVASEKARIQRITQKQKKAPFFA